MPRRETLVESRESKARWQSRLIVDKCNLITWQLATIAQHNSTSGTRRRRRTAKGKTRRKDRARTKRVEHEGGGRGGSLRRRGKDGRSLAIFSDDVASVSTMASCLLPFVSMGRIRQGRVARRLVPDDEGGIFRAQRRDKTRSLLASPLISHVHRSLVRLGEDNEEPACHQYDSSIRPISD